MFPGQTGGAYTNVTAANKQNRTDTEGCCWWGRGVILSTGVNTYGRLNYFLGAKAKARGVQDALYPDVDFCRRPDALCASAEHPELKWIAGLFYWVNKMQTFDADGFSYSQRLRAFVDGGFTDTSFIDAVSSIIDRGCPRQHCETGEVDNIPGRRANFDKVMRALALIS